MILSLIIEPIAAYSHRDNRQLPTTNKEPIASPLNVLKLKSIQSITTALPVTLFDPYKEQQQQLADNFVLTMQATTAAIQASDPVPLIIIDPVITDSLRAAANEFNIPIEILFDQTAQESNFNVNEVGTSHEIGMLQIMPDTAIQLNNNVFKIEHFKPSMLFNPKLNARFAACFLAYLRTQTNSWEDALTAYNMGEGGLHNFKKQFGNKKHSEYYVAIQEKHKLLFDQQLNL